MESIFRKMDFLFTGDNGFEAVFFIPGIRYLPGNGLNGR